MSLRRFEPERKRKTRLTGGGRAVDYHILFTLDLVASGEFSKLRLLDAVQHLPVELRQGLLVGEAG